MAATVIMTLIMLYEMIMVLIMPSHKRGSEENGEAGVCLFMAGRVAGDVLQLQHLLQLNAFLPSLPMRTAPDGAVDLALAKEREGNVQSLNGFYLADRLQGVVAAREGSSLSLIVGLLAGQPCSYPLRRVVLGPQGTRLVRLLLPRTIGGISLRTLSTYVCWVVMPRTLLVNLPLPLFPFLAAHYVLISRRVLPIQASPKT
jgi:hypothetical protein